MSDEENGAAGFFDGLADLFQGCGCIGCGVILAIPLIIIVLIFIL